MAPIVESHHHRSAKSLTHKPFKSRHLTKGLIKELSKGKIESQERGSRKTPHQQVMSKIERRHQARQLRQLKHQEDVKSSSIFSGQHGAPRIVAIIPLCKDTNPSAAVQSLLKDVDADAAIYTERLVRVRIDRFKQNIMFVLVERELLAASNASRVADYVIFLLSSMQEVDDKGELILRTIQSQGVSNVLVAVQDLDKVEPPKKRPQAMANLKSYMNRLLPTQEKIHSLDLDRECVNVVRSLCTTTPKGIKWREDRSWMLVEETSWPADKDESNINCNVVLTGVVRGRGLNANRPVQVGDWGTFQIEKITDAILPESRKRKANEMVIDTQPKGDNTVYFPDEQQDDLADLAPHEVAMEDFVDPNSSEAPNERRGVLLDDHHYFSEDETHVPELPKRLPRGTSSYQSAWFLGDVSDSDLDLDDVVDEEGDVAMDVPALPQDGIEGLNQNTEHEPTEATPSEYPQSEMFLDRPPDEETAQIEDFRSRKKNEANDDFEFPDEIELRPNVLARERLAKYRGLKSLKSSQWETSEDKSYEPEDWNRLLNIPNYKKSKNKATEEALIGGIPPGKRVSVYLRNVPLSFQKSHDSKKPLALFSLLRHEQKRAVLNISITLSSDYPNPIRSKDELILQCGSRRMIINPLFSQLGSTPNNVHKFQRYLYPGQTAMATFIAPLTWGSVPAVFFKQAPTSEPRTHSPPFEFVGTGTSQPPDHSRIIAKRIILTGHPFKIHRKLVTVRYMFFNKDDVNWFKALPLWTKRGRSGYIKESLGTHGYFKATFDGKVNPQDAVGISLYKRVFPRNARLWMEG